MPKELDRELARLRVSIDAADDELVRLLARRRKLVVALARVKRPLGIPIYDRRREAALIERVKKLGADAGVDEEFVEVLFRLVLMNSKEAQYHEAG
jgi:chorismate mutase